MIDREFGDMGFGYSFGPRDESPEQRARRILMGTADNVAKLTERREFLERNPEAVIRIDAEALREIIPFLEFKCHPKGSIARGEAMRGSDIDYALVIVPEHNEDREMAFVQRLREMGFSAYHRSEVQSLKRRLMEDQRQLEAVITAKDQVINFLTSEELNALAEKEPLDPLVLVHFAGFDIAE
jgi:hypothetical protein